MRSLVKILVALVVVLVPVRAYGQQSATVAVQAALRDKPADNGKMIWQLSKGDKVVVVDQRGDWTQVRLRVTKGWVRSSALVVTTTKSAPSASAATAERRTEARRTEPAPRSAARRARAGRPASDRNGPLGAFRNGDLVLGPAVGLGGVSGTVAVGAELEKGIQTLPELGNGALAISGQVFYYHYSFALVPGAGVTAIPFGAAANYHFALKDQRIDPFVGLGLGYTYAKVSVQGYSASAGSGVFFWGRVGARYFVKPNLALHADVGMGAANLNVGVMFRP